MSLSFCTFSERVSDTQVKMHFIFANGSATLKVDIRAAHRVNYEKYTPEEFAAIPFESFKDTPCIFNAGCGNDYVFCFQMPSNPEEFAKSQVPHYTMWDFTRADINTAWVALCEKYDPTLKSRIAAYLASKMNLTIQNSNNLSDFDKFKDLFTQIGVDFEIPKKDDGTPCDDLINLGGFSVSGAQLITVKFYEDGSFKEFIPYPDSVFHPGEEEPELEKPLEHIKLPKSKCCGDCANYRYFVGEAWCDIDEKSYPNVCDKFIPKSQEGVDTDGK